MERGIAILSSSRGEFPIGGRGVGCFKGVVGKGIDFLSSNPNTNFLEEEGARDPSQPGCGKGDHYIRKCSLPLTKEKKKKVMFISSLAKDYCSSFYMKLFSQNEYLDLVLNIVVQIIMVCSQFMFPITTNNQCTNMHTTS